MEIKKAPSVEDKTHLAITTKNLIPNGRPLEKKDKAKFLQQYKIKREADEKIKKLDEEDKPKSTRKEKTEV